MEKKLAGLFLAGFLLSGQAASMASREETPLFLSPPEHAGSPKTEHAVTNRGFQGIPSLAVSAGGRLWVTWYAGITPDEDENNYVVLSTSGDNGATWQEALVVDPDGPGVLRAFDPVTWVDPQGRLWLFWAQAVLRETDAHTWAMVTENPDAENPEWGDPRLLAPGVMMCKPTVLSDGTWLLPISDWEGRRKKIPEAATAQVWVSTDQGKTVSLRGAALIPVEHRTYDEQMFVERKDGSLWMLVRTRYGIGESISTDGGRTWPEVTPSQIPHPAARFFISRLNSGDLLLVKHGPVDRRTRRSHLTAFISADDGRTWDGGLLLDERMHISYPDGQQTADGRIYIVYDYRRISARQIFMADFLEEDIRRGDASSETVRLRQQVSQAFGGIDKEDRNVRTGD